MEQLDDFDIDSLNELINMAMGSAAAKLHELSGNEVKMSVPNVKLISLDEYKENLERDSDELISVTESFGGDFNGNAVLLFHFNKSRNLIRGLIPDFNEDDSFTNLEEEVITEIGNILLNSCISTFANVLKREFTTSIPKFNKGSTNHIMGILSDNLESGEDELKIILAEVEFYVEAKEVSGHMALTVSLPVLKTLLNELYAAVNITKVA